MTNSKPTLPSAKDYEAARLEKQRRNFQYWCQSVTPTWTWTWRHLVYIQGHLNRVTDGEIDRLMIFLPPRHSKSEQVTIRYPVWRIEKDSAFRVIVGAYGVKLAKRFSRQSRHIAKERGIKLAVEAADEWETEEGGGIRAVGVGAGVTGHGANLIIVDDPVKSREEADSETYREKVWDWYTNDLYTRQEPGCAIVLIMTRWHEDDLAGRLLAKMEAGEGDNWTVVNLPAEAEENDPLGREEGEALCPDRFDRRDLARIKRVLGRDFIALYQQWPQPREGNMFKRHWFQIVAVVPARAKRVRYWDKAGSTRKGSAYSAGVLMAEAENIYYVEDVRRGRWSWHERENMIKQTAELDDNRGVVEIWLEQEPGSGGLESAQRTIQNLAGFRVKAETVTGDKETRAGPYADQAEAGNIKLVKAPWNESYLDELCSFPSGKYKDQVDSSSGAFNKLARGMPAAGAVVNNVDSSIYKSSWKERRGMRR